MEINASYLEGLKKKFSEEKAKCCISAERNDEARVLCQFLIDTIKEDGKKEN